MKESRGDKEDGHGVPYRDYAVARLGPYQSPYVGSMSGILTTAHTMGIARMLLFLSHQHRGPSLPVKKSSSEVQRTPTPTIFDRPEPQLA